MMSDRQQKKRMNLHTFIHRCRFCFVNILVRLLKQTQRSNRLRSLHSSFNLMPMTESHMCV